MHSERSVLLCDSDDRELDELRQAFSEAGYVVRATHSSAEALREAGKEQASAIVSGATLPDGTALDLAQALRGMGMDAPLVVISNSPAHREQVRAAGLRDYFERPFRAPEIVARVNRAVEAAQNGRVLILGMDAQLAGLVARALADAEISASVAAETPAFPLERSRVQETDILLLDLDDHPADGLALILSLRAMTPGLYIIPLVSDCSRDVMAAAYAAGVPTFLRKPVRIVDLVGQVRRHLPAARRRQRSAERQAERTQRRRQEPWYRRLRREALWVVHAPAGSRRSERWGDGLATAAGLLAGVLLAGALSAVSREVPTLETWIAQILAERAAAGHGPAREGAYPEWYLSRQLELERAAGELNRRHSERYLDELHWQNLRSRTEPAPAPEPLPASRRGISISPVAPRE
jgi:DNA-binding NtrC family response regulator